MVVVEVVSKRQSFETRWDQTRVHDTSIARLREFRGRERHFVVVIYVLYAEKMEITLWRNVRRYVG